MSVFELFFEVQHKGWGCGFRHRCRWKKDHRVRLGVDGFGSSSGKPLEP